ncbi:MAG: hypothetical protein WC476_08000 [Phycisphaerae bacterium]
MEPTIRWYLRLLTALSFCVAEHLVILTITRTARLLALVNFVAGIFYFKIVLANVTTPWALLGFARTWLIWHFFEFAFLDTRAIAALHGRIAAADLALAIHTAFAIVRVATAFAVALAVALLTEIRVTITYTSAVHALLAIIRFASTLATALNTVLALAWFTCVFAPDACYTAFTRANTIVYTFAQCAIPSITRGTIRPATTPAAKHQTAHAAGFVSINH